MSGTLELVIVYSAPQQRPLAVARIRSREMLQEAAFAASAEPG